MTRIRTESERQDMADLMRRYLPKAQHARLYGMPIADMSRDELPSRCGSARASAASTGCRRWATSRVAATTADHTRLAVQSVRAGQALRTGSS